MRYAIAILTRDNNLYACHEVADSQEEAILSALKSLDIYDDEPIDSLEDLEDYLYEIDVEVEVVSIDHNTDGCVIALYDADSNLTVDYYQYQKPYDAIVHMLGGIVPLERVKTLDDLIEFIEDLDMLVDSQEVEYHD